MSATSPRNMLSLPKETWWMIYDVADKASRLALNRIFGFHDRLYKLERSAESIAKDNYACFSCNKMLPEWKFADAAITSKKGRDKQNIDSRFCIECGVSDSSLYAKGSWFFVREQRFVLCYQCDKLGRFGRNLKEARVKAICESCDQGVGPRSSAEMLEEVFAVAQNPNDDIAVGRNARQNRERKQRLSEEVREGLHWF